MDLEALIFSQDAKIVRMLSLLLADFAIRVEHCTESIAATGTLMRRKFDAVFVDFAAPQAADVLGGVRRSAGSKRALAFALVAEGVPVNSAFELGANFVLHKPLAIERTRRTLRAAHGMMMRERRKHFRLAMPSAIYAEFGREKKWALIEDISAGGIAVRVLVYDRPERQQRLQMRFTLPGMQNAIETEGEVVWADRYGRAGIRFLQFLSGAREDLEEWSMRNTELQKDDTTPAAGTDKD